DVSRTLLELPQGGGRTVRGAEAAGGDPCGAGFRRRTVRPGSAEGPRGLRGHLRRRDRGDPRARPRRRPGGVSPPRRAHRTVCGRRADPARGARRIAVPLSRSRHTTVGGGSATPITLSTVRYGSVTVPAPSTIVW